MSDGGCEKVESKVRVPKEEGEGGVEAVLLSVETGLNVACAVLAGVALLSSVGLDVGEEGGVSVALEEGEALAEGAGEEETEALLLEDERLVVEGGEVGLAAELNNALGVDTLD